MRLFKIIAMAGVLALTPAAAQAVDLLTVPTSGDNSLPVADGGFDWNGFYAGVYGVGQASTLGGGQVGIGIDAGVNARLEFVLVGAEVDVQGLTGGTGYLQALGKAGLAVTDNAVVYGTSGVGFSIAGAPESDVLLGGGLDLAVADNVSLDARYLHAFPISGANPKDQITVGANFHF